MCRLSVYIFKFPPITLETARNERKVSYPIICANFIHSAIVFMDIQTIPGTVMPIRQLRHHVLR